MSKVTSILALLIFPALIVGLALLLKWFPLLAIAMALGPCIVTLLVALLVLALVLVLVVGDLIFESVLAMARTIKGTGFRRPQR